MSGTQKLFVADRSHVDLTSDVDVSDVAVTFRFSEYLCFNLPLVKPTVSLTGKVCLRACACVWVCVCVCVCVCACGHSHTHTHTRSACGRHGRRGRALDRSFPVFSRRTTNTLLRARLASRVTLARFPRPPPAAPPGFRRQRPPFMGGGDDDDGTPPPPALTAAAARTLPATAARSHRRGRADALD